MAITGAGRILYQGMGANVRYLPTWGYLAVKPTIFPFSVTDVVEHTLKATRISEDKMEVNDVTDS